ncbi:hypothetical protein [Streptomyces sp. SHP 1-2]|uniref:hypothetical protein n=1 Tax=Streptomyces sp. SHP 1-2 TaxID=2769489 RepID=UPI002237402A|nr:hypothetical protein [Streptomyces sp. SHP 1-2]MCW5254324.1 hypothetical protein [Streptomyces sp. SHP 1-2]
MTHGRTARRSRALPLLLLAPLLMAACGTGKGDVPVGAVVSPAAGDTSAGDPSAGGGAARNDGNGAPVAGSDGNGASVARTDGNGAPAAGVAERAEALGVAPDLVYTTAVPGFTLVRQSVGVIGDDGFSATYAHSRSGATILLTVERLPFTDADCAERSPGDFSGAPGAAASCEREGAGLYYRTAGERHEYVRTEGDHRIRVTAERDAVRREVLRAAARGAHRPDAAEAAELLPPPRPGATVPVERGDLPPVGDGAPDNHVDAGG